MKEKALKHGKSIWSTVKLGLILSAYAVASCAVLAVVNNITSPVIEKNQINKRNSAMRIVFPEAETFDISDFHIELQNKAISLDGVYIAKKDGNLLGAVAQVTGPTYDTSTILVGLDIDGNITGISFLKNTDSPGFGLKASDPTFKVSSGKTFYGQFEGKKLSDGLISGVTFDGISGATITTDGVAHLIAEAGMCIDSCLKEITHITQ